MKVTIVIAVGLAIVAALLYYLLRGTRRLAGEPDGRSAEPAATSPTAPAASPPNVMVTPSSPPPPLTSEARVEASVKQLALTFAERYGSYSNQSRFANLRDLYPLATDRFRAELEAQAQAGSDDSADYYGVTTRALRSTVTLLDEDAGTARVQIATQRETTSGSNFPTITYETLTLTFIKENGSWKVDAAAWSKT